MPDAATPTPNAIVLYDGECGFCARSIQFILKRDPRGWFRFASLQSERGRALLAAHGLPTDEVKSLVLIEGGRAWLRSSGALRIARRLHRAWPLLFAFILVPPPIRDAVYNWIAKRRLSLAPPACGLPTKQERERFL